MSMNITEYSPTSSAIAHLRQKYENAVFQVSTTTGMAAAVSGRRELRELRVNLEKLRKELKAPALERSRLIDAEAKDLTGQIEALEGPIDAQIKAEEQRKADEKAEKERAERGRVDAIQAKIQAIKNIPVSMLGKASADISRRIEEEVRTPLDFSDYAEFYPFATAAHSEAITTLESMLDAALEHEAEAERLRIEAERLEVERKAQAEQAERDRVELARLRSEQAERDRLSAEAARVEREAIEAERRKQEEIRAAAEAEAENARKAAQAEIDRQRAELEEQRVRQDEADRRVRDGYQILNDFVDRFGSDKEFSIIAKTIQKWLAAVEKGVQL